MNGRQSRRTNVLSASLATAFLAVLLAGCGGGTGTEKDSGANKTYLSVDASDADGDTLQYQWRVTAGSIENRNSRGTVWTMPDGPGLHFAYVMVSDGKGGYVEQQYAVATDALGTTAPVRAAQPPSTAASSVDAAPSLLSAHVVRCFSDEPCDPKTKTRNIYLPDVRVESGGVVVGSTDLGGEITVAGTGTPTCSLPSGAALGTCAGGALAPSQNLRLFGHVDFSDGGVCGTQNEFFGIESSATVQLQQADGTALGPTIRVNRFGDYFVDAAVLVNADLRLRIQCEGYTATTRVPADKNSAYDSSRPIFLSHTIPNTRPSIRKVVANGPEGNVRGRMIVPEGGVSSNSLPGAFQFLTYKGKDTRLSACKYYLSFGAVGECDAQGNMKRAISLDDWKKQHKFSPYNGANQDVAATYVNKMDLNLVRRMVATKASDSNIAFYVCNHPGPEGRSQREVDDVINTALSGEKQVACVAMEWSTTPGSNKDIAGVEQPFTKFLTFAPDGSLMPSINLDGRGEKYMPGACVACHGGTSYSGRFPEKGNPSPSIGSHFLPFDTGNYLFSSDSALTEAAQGAAIKELNQLVRDTESVPANASCAADRPETGGATATSCLIDGWYAGGGTTLLKTYLPPAWTKLDVKADPPGVNLSDKATFYGEVVARSCRTCHVAMKPSVNWDSIVLKPEPTVKQHVCGGTEDLVRNASMPNALISRDRLLERAGPGTDLERLMTTFLGCVKPNPDPVYPKR